MRHNCTGTLQHTEYECFAIGGVATALATLETTANERFVNLDLFAFAAQRVFAVDPGALGWLSTISGPAIPALRISNRCCLIIWTSIAG